MSLATTTRLNIRGHARAALEFYESVFGTVTGPADGRDRPDCVRIIRRASAVV
ncbi:hypothetical protein [Nocardia sp. NPDC051750]|uniref:hypothetical protein n=1 Tax=Nocardia sp. NPDC051750 TaxID=3364325 RepID=UPI0037986BC3